MFQQSIFGHILLWLTGLFKQYDTSVSYHMLLRIINAAKMKFPQSMTYRILHHVVKAVRTDFFGSRLYHCFTKPSKLEPLYKSSFLYTIFSFIWQKLLWLIQKFRNVLDRINQNSFNRAVTDKIIQTTLGKFEHWCALFFAIILLVPHSFWNNLYAFIGAVALSAVYLFSAARNKAFATNARALPASLLLFCVSIVISILISPEKADSIRIALFFVSSILFMLLCAGGIQSQKTLHSFLQILLGALSILCVFAIIQRFIGVEVNPEFTDVKANAGMPGRVYATMSNPNNFAEIVVLLLPFAYAMFLNAKDPKAKKLWAISIIICFIALTMSYSRSCYVAFAISLVVFIALYNYRLLLPLAVIALICLPFLPETVMNRILTIGSMSDTSNASRIYIWIGVLDMLKNHAMTGIGLGPAAFAEFYPPYAHSLALTAPHSHMLYLELWVEFGMIGAICFLVFMFSCIKKGLTSYAGANNTLKNFIIAGIAALCGISFVCIVEYIWFYPRVMFTFWIVVGVLLCAIRLAKKEKTN